MNTISTFLAMGGYAAYVWPALGVAALVLGVLAFISLNTLKSRSAQVAVLEAENPRRARRADVASTGTGESGDDA